MTSSDEALLLHLRELVACDTRNPPREIRGGDRLFSYLRDKLTSCAAPFVVTVEDLGDGAVSLLAVRGRPTTIVNVHLDTVPDNPRWTRDPLALHKEGDRVYGLGACDIKGGAAALVAAAEATSGDIALLFTSDEEYGHSRCVHGFLASKGAAGAGTLLDDVTFVVVSEPTSCQAVLAHRGFARGSARTTGTAGHSSDPRGFSDNANHKLGRWLVSALSLAEELESEGALGLTGVRFNCGIVEGGKADNVIAAESRALFSVRPPPGLDAAEVAAKLGSLAQSDGKVLFVGPPLPARDAEEQARVARERAESLGLDVKDPVGFWTEAALFSDAGYPTFVFGPGDIEQAHIADEWVRISELLRARDVFARLMGAAS